MSKKLSGLIAAPVTPMNADGSALAPTATLTQYLTFLIERGVDGLLLAGTTGEGPLLSMTERKTLAEQAVAIVAGVVPVLVHVGCNTTAETIELAQHAAKIGADGIAVITPYYYIYDQAALATHFRRIAESVPNLPVYLYHLPAFTQNIISPDLFAQLLRTCANIAGIKYSDTDLVRLQEYRRIAGEDFSLFSGNDALEFAALALGADGCISGKASAIPEVPVALQRAFRAGDLSEARRRQRQIDWLATVLDIGEGLDLAYFKATLRYRGLDVGGVRPPQRYLTEAEEEALHLGLDNLRRRGVLDVEFSSR